MEKMALKYELDDKPSLSKLLIFGLQWLAIAIPMIIIVGKVVATLHYDNPAQQIIYIQKVFFVIGISVFIQVLWGHKLPLIIGPAAVLLVGIAASQGRDISTVYTSILIGGFILALLSISGLFERLQKLFTPRVIVTILVLIGFTLTPMIIRLIMPAEMTVSPLHNLLFVLTFILCVFIANRFLTGLWKSTLIISAMIIGSLVYIVIFPQAFTPQQASIDIFAFFFQDFNTKLTLDVGVLVSFLICYLALAINDLGSIRSIGEMLQADDMAKRTSRGITWTGILNMLSGFFGVIGSVNYSLSPGVIASTGVASRFTLVPTGIGLMILAFIPPAIRFIGNIPSVVIGSAFIYILCSQIAAGLYLAFTSMKNFRFENGLILGLPLMLSIIISFLPEEAVATFPLTLKPILGNGFVIGVISVLIMEHIIYKEKNKPA
ncbi:MAG: xanthine permease [Gracilibacter sp. BRH_c7a]|nr:MAG: xanthine permease [Gracilibacter sp. BRH_c7a]